MTASVASVEHLMSTLQYLGSNTRGGQICRIWGIVYVPFRPEVHARDLHQEN